MTLQSVVRKNAYFRCNYVAMLGGVKKGRFGLMRKGGVVKQTQFA